MHKPCLVALLITLQISGLAAAQAKKQKVQPKRRNDLRGAQVEVFKTVGDVELKMHIFRPKNDKPNAKRSAIVFFFGGGWRGGSPSQFANHCRYLASRGMVAMTAEYRVHSRHKAKVVDCIVDAKSAMRWARGNASRLGIDPNRIAAGGGSAGGHLAAAVGTLDGFNQPGEDTSISARPNAMLLFNPALDLTAEGFGDNFQKTRYDEIQSRMGTNPKAISPTYHIGKEVPPTIIFHGKADTTVPYAQAKQFASNMHEAGNRCELKGYGNKPHGFFNYGRDGNKAYTATLRQADEFLKSIGFLQGKPTVGQGNDT